MIFHSMILFLLPTAAGLSMPFALHTFSAAESNFIRAYERRACPADKVTCGAGFSAVIGIGYNKAFMRAYEGDKREFCEWFKGQKSAIRKVYATDEIAVDHFVKTTVEKGDWDTIWYKSVYYTGFNQC